MSTKTELNNHEIVSEEENCILSINKEAEEEIRDILIDDKRFAVVSTFTDKYIEQRSEDFLMKSDYEAYGLRNAVLSFYPGKIDDKMIRCDYDHMLITGKPNSGKIQFVENIIHQLILRYGRWQVNLNVWDGKRDNFIGSNRGPEFIDISGFNSTAEECSLVSYLKERVMCLKARLKMLKDSGFETIEGYNSYYEYKQINYPYQVILLEEPDVGLGIRSESGAGIGVRREIQEQIIELLLELLWHGKQAGIYLILSMSQSDWVVRIYDAYFKYKGYTFATRLDDKVSNELFGYGVATEDFVGKHGKAVIKELDGKLDIIDVPFYQDRILRGICKGELVPLGQKFSYYKLKQLKRMHFGVEEKENDISELLKKAEG